MCQGGGGRPSHLARERCLAYGAILSSGEREDRRNGGSLRRPLLYNPVNRAVSSTETSWGKVKAIGGPAVTVADRETILAMLKAQQIHTLHLKGRGRGPWHFLEAFFLRRGSAVGSPATK